MRKLYLFFIVFCLVFFQSCGARKQGGNILPGGDDSPDVLTVSLNDAFTTVTPNGSEKVTLSDSRRFFPPNFVSVVLGTYAGNNPAQWLHARIDFGAYQCIYEATSVVSAALMLQTCSPGSQSGVTLNAGESIELVNYDSPGYLLQADFQLTR